MDIVDISDIDYEAWLNDMEAIYEKLTDEYDRDAVAFSFVIAQRVMKLEAMLEKREHTLQ